MTALPRKSDDEEPAFSWPRYLGARLLNELRWLLFLFAGAILAAGGFAAWWMLDHQVWSWRLGVIVAAAIVVAVAWSLLVIRTFRRALRAQEPGGF